MSKMLSKSTLNIFLWLAQLMMAVTLVWAGYTKFFTPPDVLASMWAWTADHPGLVKITGFLDLLAGIGLTIPSALKIMPKATVWAAYGTAALMVAAIVLHISRGEYNQLGFNVFVASLAVFVAWGRDKIVPNK